MLSLEPPYPVIDGHALLPDHADPLLWYVMPSAPRLAVRNGRPALDLTLFANAETGQAHRSGGILNLTTELAIPDELLAALPGRLVAQGLTPRTPTVVPVSFDTGRVELAVLGRTSTPPPTGSAGPGGLFEVNFVAGGQPSLTATNDATFQLLLDETSAGAIAGTLAQAAEPVVVTYVMTYAALRPAFSVDLDADWSRIYHSLRNRLTTNAWVVSADLDSSIIRAFEDSGIRIDTIVESTGAGDRAAAQRVTTQLLDWVTNRLFTSMIPPAGAAEGVAQVIDDTISSLSRAIIPGASYRLKEMDDSQLQHLQIRMRERVGEAREVRLQGTLDGLLRTLRFDPDGTERASWPTTCDQLVHHLELSAFPRLDVTVAVVDRFGSDGLHAVDIELSRAPVDGTDPAPEDFATLTFMTPTTQHWVVNLLDEARSEPDWDRPYVYRTIARFGANSPLRPGETVTSAWSARRAVELVIDPREAYAVTEVTVSVAPLFSFGAFPAVSVELVPAGPPTSPADLSRVAHIQLDAATPVATWVFASPVTDRAYAFRTTYHRPVEAGGPVVGPWASMAEPFLSLPDPMPEKLTVAFFVDLPWSEISVALLEIRYQDPAQGIRYAPETIALDAATGHLSRTYSIASGGSRGVDYRLTIQRSRGGLIDGSWRTATDDRVIVDRRLIDERVVRLSVLGALADKKLVRARVQLQTRDPGTGHALTSTDFDITTDPPPTSLGPFTYLPGDPPLLEVWWQLSSVDGNGFPVAQPWGHGSSDLLVVDLRSLTVTG